MKKLLSAALPFALLALVVSVFVLWPEPNTSPALPESPTAQASDAASPTGPMPDVTSTHAAREELPAPAPREPEAPATNGIGSLHGRIVAREAGAIANATVALDWEDLVDDVTWQAELGLRPIASDAAGRFDYQGLPARGRYRVRVRYEGFVALQSSDYGVFAGQATDAGDLILTPGARVTGSVMDERGSPVVGAMVTIKDREPVRTTTSARGEFVLADLAAGRVAVVVFQDGYWPAQKDVRLEAGREAARLEFTLRMALSVAGTITDTDGKAIAAATIQARFRGLTSSAMSDARGRYAITLAQPTQPYRMQVSALGHRPQVRDRMTAPQDGVDFMLEPLPRIEVVLRDARTGGPVIPVGLQLRDDQPNTPDDDHSWQRIAPGRYAVYYPQPGSYRIAASAEGYDAQESTPVATDGTSNYGPLTLAMIKTTGADALGVIGVVRSARTQAPIAGATVELRRTDTAAGAQASFEYGVLAAASAPLVATTRCDSGGQFEFTHLASGEYELRASSANHAASANVPVIVVAGDEPASVELWLHRGGTIAGMVTGLDGHAAGDLPLVALREDGFAQATRADTTGFYAIQHLEAGRYRVEVGDRSAPPRQAWPRGQVSSVANLESGEFGVAVADDAVTRLDINLRSPPGWATVFGYASRDGAVAAGSVELVRLREPFEDFDEGLHQPRVQPIGDDGSFAFASVRRGTYLVRLRLGTVVAVRQVRAAPGDALRVDFAIELGKLGGRTVAIHRRPQPVSARLRLTPLTPHDWQMELREFAISDGAGSFDFGLVPAGNYRLETTADKLNADVREVRVRGADTSLVRIELKP